MNKRKVDIIGAGISGLSTAYYLASNSNDIHIRVWDRDQTPGGLAGNFYTEKYALEKFYHHIFLRDKPLVDLISSLGLTEKWLIIWFVAKDLNLVF